MIWRGYKWPEKTVKRFLKIIRMSGSKQAEEACRVFLDGLREILKDKLYGVYIYGAAAFPGTFPLGDIDFHVILKEELTESERSRLEKLHEYLDEKYPPTGETFDGYYVLLEDACKKASPQSQMWGRATDDSWALHRAHILAGRQITLYGPEPKEIYPPVDWPEIEDALYGELDYVEKNLLKYPGYCALNLCRLIYSFETKNVVISKEVASKWAVKNLQGWEKYIESAVKLYCRRSTTKDEQFVRAKIGEFLKNSKNRIELARKQDQNQ